MPLIIDTMNVLHVTGVLPPDLAGLDVGDLVELMRMSRVRTQQATLVCDGASLDGVKAGRAGLITIRFSGRGRTADDVIIDMVNRSSIPRRLTVVSTDNAVLRAARKRRCAVMTSESFLRQIAADVRELDRPVRRKKPIARPTSAAMSAEQVDKWISIFNADVDAIAKQLERMHPADEPTEEPKQTRTKKRPPKARTKKLDEQTKTKRGESGNREAQRKDRDPPKPVLPKDFVAEAERMVAEYEASRIKRSK